MMLHEPVSRQYPASQPRVKVAKVAKTAKPLAPASSPPRFGSMSMPMPIPQPSAAAHHQGYATDERVKERGQKRKRNNDQLNESLIHDLEKADAKYFASVQAVQAVQASKSEEPEDQAYHYCRSLAMDLRSLPAHTQRMAKTRIQNLMMEYMQEQYDKDNAK
jgi:hypothetical protein